MKKALFMVILVLTMSACSKSDDLEKASQWDCTVSCAEQSNEGSYVITYSDEKIISRTGTLSFQNQNDFDIVVHLFTKDQEEKISEIVAGGSSVLFGIAKDTNYTVGCHADVDEGTEIKLMVYDGEETGKTSGGSQAKIVKSQNDKF